MLGGQCDWISVVTRQYGWDSVRWDGVAWGIATGGKCSRSAQSGWRQCSNEAVWLDRSNFGWNSVARGVLRGVGMAGACMARRQYGRD